MAQFNDEGNVMETGFKDMSRVNIQRVNGVQRDYQMHYVGDELSAHQIKVTCVTIACTEKNQEIGQQNHILRQTIVRVTIIYN